MDWIEIIDLKLKDRSDRHALRRVLRQVTSRPFSSRSYDFTAKLFRNIREEDDWSIHLFRERSTEKPGKTDTGMTIAGAVSSLGNVNHTIWKKIQG